MEMNIALLPGDGIGPEVIAQAVKVVHAVGKNLDIRFPLKRPLREQQP